MSEVVHIAGLEVCLFGRYLRQRCAWCGEILSDYDLTLTASSDGSRPKCWPVNALVAIDGPGSWTLPETDRLPDNACAPPRERPKPRLVQP
jgi:hypothetical protein